MSKQEFLTQLRKGLYGLPQEDIEDRLAFYGEMIDDQIEEGLSEEEAILSIGSVENIVTQVIADIPLTKLARERIKPKRQMKGCEIVLLAVGSPVWGSLLIAVFAIVFSLYLSMWAVIGALWSVFSSLVVCAIGCVVSGVGLAVTVSGVSGLIAVAAGLLTGGLSIFAFYGCLAASRGGAFLTRKLPLWIKGIFIKKEDV